LFFFLFLLGIEDVFKEGADTIVGVQCFEVFIILVLNPDVVPFTVILDLVFLELISELLAIFSFLSVYLFFFFLV